MTTSWYAYIPDRFTNTVTPINTSTNIPSDTIAVGSFPSRATISPNAKTVYVMNSGLSFQGIPGSITVIDRKTNKVKTTIALGDFYPGDIAITPDGKKIYVVGVSGSGARLLLPISTATNVVGDTIDLGVFIYFRFAITPDGKMALLLNAGLDRVLPVNLVNGTLGSIISFGSLYSLTDIAITPNGQSAYITTSGLAIYQLNIPTLTIGTPININFAPDQIAITPDGKTIYVTCPNGGNTIVLSIDIATQLVTAVINTAPRQPFAIAITPDSGTAYVTTSGGATLPISLATRTVGDPIPVVGDAIAITPDQAPVAFFTATRTSILWQVLFDASKSTSPTGNIVSYAWNFGDGKSLVTTSPTISHKYAPSPKEYQVTLIVTNSAGASLSKTFTGRIVSNNGGPSAKFSRIVSLLDPPVIFPLQRKRKCKCQRKFY